MLCNTFSIVAQANGLEPQDQQPSSNLGDNLDDDRQHNDNLKRADLNDLIGYQDSPYATSRCSGDASSLTTTSNQRFLGTTDNSAGGGGKFNAINSLSCLVTPIRRANQNAATNNNNNNYYYNEPYSPTLTSSGKSLENQSISDRSFSAVVVATTTICAASDAR